MAAWSCSQCLCTNRPSDPDSSNPLRLNHFWVPEVDPTNRIPIHDVGEVDDFFISGLSMWRMRLDEALDIVPLCARVVHAEGRQKWSEVEGKRREVGRD